MPFVSVTRLRIRSARFLPSFAWQTYRSLQQIRRAEGFKDGSILADRRWTFWTMTVWDSQEDMRRYMTEGAHRKAMPYLLDWCDEASVVHWTQPGAEVPAWTEADERMRGSGRISKVRHPSSDHATLRYRAPRTTTAGPIRRERTKTAQAGPGPG